jgi:hypothetical protein
MSFWIDVSDATRQSQVHAQNIGVKITGDRSVAATIPKIALSEVVSPSKEALDPYHKILITL